MNSYVCRSCMSTLVSNGTSPRCLCGKGDLVEVGELLSKEKMLERASKERDEAVRLASDGYCKTHEACRVAVESAESEVARLKEELADMNMELRETGASLGCRRDEVARLRGQLAEVRRISLMAGVFRVDCCCQERFGRIAEALSPAPPPAEKNGRPDLSGIRVAPGRPPLCKCGTFSITQTVGIVAFQERHTLAECVVLPPPTEAKPSSKPYSCDRIPHAEHEATKVQGAAGRWYCPNCETSQVLGSGVCAECEQGPAIGCSCRQPSHKPAQDEPKVCPDCHGEGLVGPSGEACVCVRYGGARIPVLEAAIKERAECNAPTPSPKPAGTDLCATCGHYWAEDCTHAGEPISGPVTECIDFKLCAFLAAGNESSPKPAQDGNRRAPGCLCHLEEGDSPCPVHCEEGCCKPAQDEPASLRRYIKPPFRADYNGGMIHNADGLHFADVRGWGALAYEKDGGAVQDFHLRFMVDALNAAASPATDPRDEVVQALRDFKRDVDHGMSSGRSRLLLFNALSRLDKEAGR